jgi:AraC-like DNA-binding protein
MSIKGQFSYPERELPAVDVLPRPVFARNETLPGATQTIWHSHDWIQISYAIKGMLTLMTEHNQYAIPPQWAVWIPAGVAHQTISSAHVEMRGLYIDRRALPALADESQCQVIEVSPLLRELIRTFCTFPKEYDEEGAEGRLVQVLKDQLIAAATTGFALPIPDDPKIRHMYQVLLAHPDDQRTLQEWGQLLGASEKTLSRHILGNTGLTFRLWRQRLRLFSALRLLEEGTKITQVALACGYESTSAFIVAFRSYFRKTPGDMFE